jgi:hypothetical protein
MGGDHDTIDVRGEPLATLSDFDAAREVVGAGARAHALRRAAERLGDRLRAAAPATRVELLALDRLPATARAAFDGALAAPVRWVTLERRALYLELPGVGAEATPLRVLVDPVAPGAWQRSPWGARFVEKHPRRARALGRGCSIEAALAGIGVTCESIDLVVITHLRGQDLRPLLGTVRGDGLEGPRPGLFPRARWLVTRTEWEDALAPHDHERPHIVQGGLDRLDRTALMIVDRDLAITPAAAWVRTPGVTAGHATLFVHARRGTLAWTSHGTAVDAWSPYHARLPGLRARVRELGVACVPRGDCASRIDALTSMGIERAVADRRADAPVFHRIVPQQELVPGLLLRPLCAIV